MKVQEILIQDFPIKGPALKIMSYLKDGNTFKFKRCHYIQSQVNVYHDNRLIAQVKGERLYFVGNDYVSVKNMVRLKSMVKTAILKTNKY